MPLSPLEAERIIRSHLPRIRSESYPLKQAFGRTLRMDIRADRDLPPFNRITMDGYALRSLELTQGVLRYEVQGFSPAGQAVTRLSNRAQICQEVATGAVLPEGSDLVVPREWTKRDNGHIELKQEALQLLTGNAVHPRASDAVTGALLVQSGLRLGARELAVAASQGFAQLTVAALPRITLLSTGDELVEPGAKPEAWQLRRSNDVALAAALQAQGFSEVRQVHLRDNEDELFSALGAALEQSDVIITTGAISKGRLDLLAGIFGRLGIWELFHGVDQRPGKPFYFGRGSNDVPVFALPGNPVSAFLLLHRYVIPALHQASGARPLSRVSYGLAEDLRPDAALSCFHPVVVQPGQPRIRIQKFNTSGDYAALLGTSGFIQVAPGTAVISAGTPFELWTW